MSEVAQSLHNFWCGIKFMQNNAHLRIWLVWMKHSARFRDFLDVISLFCSPFLLMIRLSIPRFSCIRPRWSRRLQPFHRAFKSPSKSTKMQFLFPILLTLLALIAPVFSVPHNNHKRSPKNIKKAGGGPGPKVLVCTDENFKGDCEENVMNDGLCWILNGAYKRKWVLQISDFHGSWWGLADIVEIQHSSPHRYLRTLHLSTSKAKKEWVMICEQWLITIFTGFRPSKLKRAAANSIWTKSVTDHYSPPWIGRMQP